jgi:hypothetical protein
MKKIISLALALSTFAVAFAQPTKKSVNPYEQEYQERIKQKEIDGIYIPKDLNDAFTQLDQLIDDADKDKTRSVEEELAVKKLFPTLGRWMWVNWHFMEGSRLSAYLASYGLKSPEDMSSFLIRSYHRYLNKKDLDIKGQMAVFKAKYEQKKQDKMARIQQQLRKETGDTNLVVKPVEQKKPK